MNTFQLSGLVIGISPPTNNSTAKITIQHNSSRQKRKGSTRQYVNAIEVRVADRAIKDLEGLKAGMVVSVFGRMQGILQSLPMGAAQFYCEPVASRIEPWNFMNSLIASSNSGSDTDEDGGNADGAGADA